MSEYTEVSEPIQNSPFEKPTRYWYIQEGEAARIAARFAGASQAQTRRDLPAERPARHLDG